jgi:hypothetical protein
MFATRRMCTTQHPPTRSIHVDALPQVSLSAALHLVRSGQHPLELQGLIPLLPKLHAALAPLLASSHRAFSSATAWSGEAAAKDRAPQAMLLVCLIRLLPLLRPEGWPAARLDLLPA